MEFGIFVQAHVPESEQAADPVGAEHARLVGEVEVVKLADATNWKYVWATEHHFLREYSHLSANEVFLGYVAAATQQIHVGSGIFNITAPVNHPARIAERVAMLDHLSGGRFEFGTGRGSSTTEQAGFGITDPELTRSLYDEALGEIIRMWADEPYSYDGTSFSMPARDVLPKPYTKPHPPLWVAAGSPPTFEKAARLGLGVLCFANSSIDEIAPMVEVYKKAIVDAEPIGGYVNDNIAVATIATCLPDRDEARRAACSSGTGRLQSLVFRYLDTFPKPEGIPDWPELIPDPTPEDLDWRIDNGYAMVGDPDDCARAVQRYVDIGVDQIINAPTAAAYPTELVHRSVETFGTEVIPRFDTDPVHRTTRLREAAS
jgi:alkanesulfonate monooxygenase SsuD/methylene tetrahydromethanopterin reductase-like flavin-dependent oxidoreductase (luciferase family)